MSQVFVVLEKGYADDSQRFSFRDFVRHGTAVLMRQYDNHEDAARHYAEHQADAWEWDEDEPHEFLVGNESATRLSDLRVVTVSKAIAVHYQSSVKGDYERRVSARSGKGA